MRAQHKCTIPDISEVLVPGRYQCFDLRRNDMANARQLGECAPGGRGECGMYEVLAPSGDSADARLEAASVAESVA